MRIKYTDLEECSICRKTIIRGQAVSNCPWCFAKFHQPHFLEAIKIIGKCPTCKRDVSNHQINQIPEILSRLRIQHNVQLTFREALQLKTVDWKENKLKKIALAGKTLRILHDEISPRNHEFRRLVVQDETANVVFQVWGRKRMRILDDYSPGDIVVVKNPKRPYVYHEKRGVDFWVHENYSELAIIST